MWDGIITGVIPWRIQYFGIAVSVLLLLFIVHLIRGGRLKEGYSLIWLLITAVMVMFSVFAGLLEWLAKLIGIAYTPAALFFIVMGGLILLAIHYSLLLHRYDQRIRALAQEHAILKEQISRNKTQDTKP